MGVVITVLLTAMLDLTAIQTQLRQISKSVVRTVELGTNQGDIKPNSLPALFILPTQENAGTNQRVGGVLQEVATNFAIEIVINNLRISQWVIDLEKIRQAVHDQLLNTNIGNGNRVIEFSTGSLLSADKNTARWIDEFSTSYQISL